MEKRRMVLNAFEAIAPGHHDHGMWKYPGNQSDYFSLDYWTSVAQRAERGMFDAVFLVDIDINDAYENSARTALTEGTYVPYGDPLQTISAMAAVTKNLGFVITASTSYWHPWRLARTFSTLDHLTDGRVSWNIVTSYLKSGAINSGLDLSRFEHDKRYEIAAEFIDVVYKLWEGSWEDDAVVKDVDRGVYTDPTKVHPILHDGEWYKVPGIHASSPSPQRTPFLFQAGSSPVGRAFAAQNAEGTYVLAAVPEAARAAADKFRDELEKNGRPRYSAKVITQALVITGKTNEEAQAKAEEYFKCSSLISPLVHNSGGLGIDLSKYDLDQPIETIEDPAVHGLSGFMTSLFSDPNTKPSFRDVMEFCRFGSMGPTIVGDAKTVADELERWMEVGDVDGFNIQRLVQPDTMEDFIEHVVPELQERGRVWREYPQETTMREKMTGGASHVADWHPASKYRGAYVGKRSAAEENPY